MNVITHIAFAFVLLEILFPSQAPATLFVFALIFGGLVDLDSVIMPFFSKGTWRQKRDMYRTWVQEPLGLVVIGLPAAFIINALRPGSFWLVLIPYASQVLLDYISFHDVMPLAPISKKDYRVGLIKPFKKPHWHEERKGYLSETVFLALLVIAIFLVF
ncbi:MAG: metal-dependent hydrolase [Candidatus Woesearchaeota archaeon]